MLQTSTQIILIFFVVAQVRLSELRINDCRVFDIILDSVMQVSIADVAIEIELVVDLYDEMLQLLV